MDVKLPKLGEGADTGTVVSVLVREGDQVEPGQIILELENEKAVAPVPTQLGGVVRAVRVKVGDVIAVGHVLLSLEVPDDKPLESTSRTTVKASPAAVGSKREPPRDRPQSPRPEAGDPEPIESTSAAVAAPSIRRTARALGISLSRVRGTGPGGRVEWDDLRGYIERLQALAYPPKPATASEAAGAPVSIDYSQWGPVTRKPLSTMRQTISRRMVESWTSIPHVTQFDEIDITDVEALRKQMAGARENQSVKLTLTPFVVKSLIEALRKHPILNASLDESSREVVYKGYFHIGIAVDTDQGLLVPVVRHADQKSLLDLAREIADLAEKARTRKLSLEEMKGGTFTLSNQGGIGGGYFTPIINKPEVAILGLGRGILKPVLRDGAVVTRLLMPVGLSYDHRLIDGGTAARFAVDLALAFKRISESLGAI